MVKNPSANAVDSGDVSLVPGSGRYPGKGNAAHTLFLSGKSRGERSLEVSSPWGHRELDMTERMHMHRHTHTHTHTHTQTHTEEGNSFFNILGGNIFIRKIKFRKHAVPKVCRSSYMF